MKTYKTCPVCGTTSFSPFIVCKDYTVSKESFNIVSCDNCSFKFTNPIPDEKAIGRYYESDEYISHSNTSKGLVNSLYQTVRNHTLKKKVQLISSLTKDKTLLDVGSGTGEFLNQCQISGYNVQGVEPSSTGREQALNNFNLKIKEEDYLDEIPKDSIGVVTMWHVLEHVYHLNERIEQLYKIIKPNGYLIVAVPNHTSFDAENYKEHWAAYDVPRHLYHFSPQIIKQLFEKHKFLLERTLPMKFDSFYVSMLSEKYKTGKTNLFSAFMTGLKSNLKAGKENTYSSQIYILKKAI